MKKLLLCVLVCASTLATAFAQTIPYSKGRIAISSDGNEHDHDDWAATPFSLALLAASGMQNKLVLYTFSDHIWGSNHDHSDGAAQMRISALEGKTQFGFPNTQFIEAVANPAAAVTALITEINKSTAADPLTIIAAGPMEVVGRALNGANVASLPFVMLISHSTWNDRHSDNPDSWENHSGWQWSEMQAQFASKGVTFRHIVDQNGGSGYDGLRTAKANFGWLQTSPARNNPAYKPGSWDWLYSRQLKVVKGGDFDASDAGMVVFLLTGVEKTNPTDAKRIMENPVGGTDPCAGNTAPTVALTSPADGSSFPVGTAIGLTASASDNGTVTKVDFYNGTTLISTDNTAPYTASLTGLAAGSYSLTAKATDNCGATKTSAAVAVTVTTVTDPCAGNTAPGVSLTAPANGASYAVGATINLTATATDADGSVSKVDFYNGTTLISTDNTAPYAAAIANAAAGSYTLTAKATDNCGATKTSAAVAVTVTTGTDPCAGNTAPVVALTSPADGSSFPVGTAIGLTASASDNGTVTKVDFYNGTTLISTDNTAPYTASLTGLAAGSYSLTAKATDNCGATKTSAVVAITVSVVSTGDITGPACVAANSSATFELSAANRANATSYAWWYTASSQSLTPVAGMPYKAVLASGPSFAAGEICVGVNYSVAPWYKQFCIRVGVCGSAARLGAALTEATVQVSPNPFTNEIRVQLSAQEQVQKVELVSANGAQIQVQVRKVSAGNFNVHVPQVAAGYYILKVQTQNEVKVMRLIRNK